MKVTTRSGVSLLSVLAFFLTPDYVFSKADLEKELSYFSSQEDKALGEEDESSRFDPELASAKLSSLWDSITEERYKGLPIHTSAGIFGSMNMLLPENYYQDFSFDDDVLSEPVRPMTHAFGSVAKVKWVPHGGHPFSGIFRSGADSGVLRLSMAWRPEGGHSIPGAYLKFFVDHHPSLDLKLQGSGDPVEGTRFFSHSMTNILAIPDSSMFMSMFASTLAIAMRSTGRYEGSPFEVSAIPFSTVQKNGVREDSIRAPYRLILRPTLEAYNLVAQRPEGVDPRDQINGQGQGEVLYLVYATELRGKKPTESGEFLVGFIQAESDFLSSAFADTRLFFRHNS